jgi:O-antigen ligase
MLVLWLLVLLPPLYIAPAALEPFRLPKLMLAEWLAVASLLPLAWQLRAAERVRWSDPWRQPAVRAALPLVLVATAGLALTGHPEHVRQALADLWIGAACLAAWSAGLSGERLRRLLGALLWPGVALALLGILQFHGLQPLQFAGIRAGSRMAITSTAGNPGDLAAFLVLPCLVAQWLLARGGPAAGAAAARPPRSADGQAGRRGWLVAALAVCAYGMALTETFAALAALLLGSLIFWALALRGTAGVRRFAAVAAALVVLTAAVTAAVPGLRTRALVKLQGIRQGDLDVILTGRLDGWRTALWMLRQHPWAGVGQGAYRAEFAPAKIALVEHGSAFSTTQQQIFVNAHDEPLEVAADCGLPGLAALAWGLWVVAGAVRRRAAAPDAIGATGATGATGAMARLAAGAAASAAVKADAAFAVAGAVALAALCLVDFPFRIALVAFPALLFLAWLLRPAPAAPAPAPADTAGQETA